MGKAALVVDALPTAGTVAVEMVTRDEPGESDEAGTASYFDAWALDEVPAPKTPPPALSLPRGSVQLRVTLTGDGRVAGVVAASAGYRPPPPGILEAIRTVRFSPPVARGERVSTTVDVTAVADDGPDAGPAGWTRTGLGWLLRVDPMH